MLQGDKNSFFNNDKGYPDPTAFQGLNSITQEEQKLDKKVHNLINVLKFIVDWAVFEFIGRIQLRHKESRKEFK